MSFVSISPKCEFEDLLKRMLIQMSVDEESLRKKEVQELLEKLKAELGDEKYLVVLDDVWGNERSWWDSLKSALPRNLGCCVIVTTRNKNMARTMGAIEKHIHRPKILSNDDSWSLFSKIAFAWNGGKYPNSDVACLGKEIVARCKGLPLAITVVGGMMLGKGDSVSEWRRILEHVKEVFVEKPGELAMSSLELSYEELPTYLKPCFLCFSMLPEDYLIAEIDIVSWWIGEGFVLETTGRTSIETGVEYLKELCDRCLLICEDGYLIGEDGYLFKTHDLVRDMVIKIARDVNFTSLNERRRPELSAQSRRLGIFGPIENVESTEAKKSKIESKLRTLWGLNMEDDVLLNKNLELRKLKQLRVLYASFLLNGEQITVKSWLCGITSPLNLVSLSLENCTVEELPDSIGNLHNLQILLLRVLLNLKKLPSTISKLDKLISFRVYYCESLTCMPEGIGRLSKLERFVWFPYAESSQRIASFIGQLKNLKQLKELRVELKNQNNLQELILNVLSELKHLHFMEISFFNYDFEGGVSVSNLNHLPVQCLERLILTFWPGESTPVWLNPTFLPNLKFLTIDKGNRGNHLRYMSPEFWEGNWKIERLRLKYLGELEEEWIMFLRAMPSLRIVEVSYCPKLKSFPLDVTQPSAIWRKDDNTPGGH